MKINKYKLRDGVTKQELLDFGFKESGNYVIDENGEYYKGKVLFYGKNFEDKHIDKQIKNGKEKTSSFTFEYDIDIAFKLDNINAWDDFHNVIVLDSDFCQPYYPFYQYRAGECKPFPVLRKVVERYNEFMDSMPFLAKQ